MNQIIINAREQEKRFAVVENHELKKFFIERPEQKSCIGNIYYGIVEKVMPSMDGAFVRIGKDKKGFLHRTAIPAYTLDPNENKSRIPLSSLIHQGEKMIVQVVKDETGSKYCRLTGLIEISGDYLIYLPYSSYIAVSKKLNDVERNKWKQWAKNYLDKNEGVIIRTFAMHLDEDKVFAELQQLRAVYQNLVRKAQQVKAPTLLQGKDHFLAEILKETEKNKVEEILADERNIIKNIQEQVGNIPIVFYQEKENIFSRFHLDRAIEQLTKKVVWLENGANIVIEETETATIIDVNTSKFTKQNEYKKTIMETNRLAAKEIARQIILRKISGIILIDFINMETDEERESIINILEEELDEDELPTKIFGFTALGILEMARKRTTPSLKEQMQRKCPVCHGSGAVLSLETIVHQLERELMEYRRGNVNEISIEATEDVIDYVSSGNHFKDHFPFKISFISVNDVRPFYRIKQIQ